MSYEFHDTIDSGGSSSNDDSGGGSPSNSYSSVTRDRGGAGAGGGGEPTVGVGDDPSDVGPNPRSPVDDSGGSNDSTSGEPDNTSVGSVTRDRGSAGASDDGGGPTLGLGDISGDITITGTTDETPQNPQPGPDLVGDDRLEELLDNVSITLPGDSAGEDGSTPFLVVAGVVILAILSLVLGYEI